MRKNLLSLLLLFFAPIYLFAQTPVTMSSQPGLTFSADFADIANWTFNGTTGLFSAGTGSAPWKGNASGGTGAIPTPLNLTTSTLAFSSGSTGGIQKGTGNLLFLTTGATVNTTSLGFDLFLDFTGTSAGTISFDAATVFNSTGDRVGSLRVYASTDGTSWTEVTGTNLPYVATNNVAGSASITNVALPASLNGSSTARLRFYYHNGSTNGAAGSRPKISMDNLSITATSSSAASLSVSPASLSFPVTNINTPATSQTFTITGTNVTAPVSVVTGGAYLLSETEAGTYTTSLSIPAANVSTAKTVYVRFTPTTAGAANGTVTVNTTTAAEKVVTLTGTGFDPAAPVLTINPSTLTFPTTAVGSNSTSQTYQLSATNLTGDITVTASSSYTVSLDNNVYTTSVVVSAADPALASGKTIYVVFTPATGVATPGTITNVSAGAATKTVNVSGTGIELIELSSPPYLQDFNDIGSGLPLGITVRTGATATAIGTVATFNTAPALWSNTGGVFKNYASGNNDQGIPQNTATDRALGVRQTGSFGDPGAGFVFQVDNTVGKINFTLDFLLQSLDASSGRSTTWRIDYGVGASPSSFIVPSTTGNLTTGGNTYASNPVHVDFGNALDNIADIITIRILAVTASSGSGNRASTGIDDFNLSWEDPTAQTISLSTTGIAFPTTAVGASSAVSTYTIVKQTNLTEPIVVTATAPYLISADNVTFGSSLSVDQAAAFNKTIYVKFSPVAVGVFPGTITHTSAGAVDKVINLSGEAIDPAALTFNFNTCAVSSIPGSGFLSINVTGVQKWGCSQYGRPNNSSSTNGVDVNGFSGGAAQTNDAWLISPAINLNSISNIPVLSFYSRGEFSGPKLQLLVSTTYDGSSVPVLSDWTELNGNFPTPPGSATSAFTLSDNIDLSAYKTAPKVYIAFRYTSSAALNAARWTVDDIAITDQSSLLNATPNLLSFGEVSAGASSASQPFNFKAIGSMDITLTPPAGYEISADNNTFGTGAIVVPQATAAAGTNIYVRFSPTVKALKIEGNVTATATGLNKSIVAVTGSSYPKSETLDAACYNISFFGSNSTNNATAPEIATQVANISTVMQRLNMDVIGIEEMSNDAALAQLVANLPGYASVVSNRWSYSFNPPDPDFPPQKIGFIYNTATMSLSASEPPRVMFESLYDSARLNLPGRRLTDYPTASASSFWASGRLPYMATFNANINGALQKIRIVVVHAKSGGDQDGYIRRQYDVKLLKDSLDAYYATDKVIILGDYNDRMVTSIYPGNPSSYQPYLDDNTNYTVLTLPLDQAGRTSFPSGTGMIDHITVSNELIPEYIATSTDIEDARAYIPGYNATTASDHLPVFARFSLQSVALPVRLVDFNATPVNNTVQITWTTASEQNNSHFIVERSAGSMNGFVQIGRVNGNGNSNSLLNYSLLDQSPVAGNNYYRLKQVDIDGKAVYSNVVLVKFGSNAITRLLVYPNPVTNQVTVNLNGSRNRYTMTLTTADGTSLLRAAGTVAQINTVLNDNLTRLNKGVYILQMKNANEVYTTKLIRQ